MEDRKIIIPKLILISIVRKFKLSLLNNFFRFSAIHHSNNQIVLFTILISVLLLILFGFLFLGCYCKLIIFFEISSSVVLFSVRNKKLYGKLKKKYYQNGEISDKELEHLRSLTYANTLKDNILYTWR